MCEKLKDSKKLRVGLATSEGDISLTCALALQTTAVRDCKSHHDVSSVMTSSLLKRNKEADFKVCIFYFAAQSLPLMTSSNIIERYQVIEESSNAISRHLKADEGNPDLDEQFRSLSLDAGRHKYFLLPYKNLVWGQAVEQSDFIPFPDQILKEYSKVECASFMGIIPEIHR